jgi:hypothetical protein
MFVMNVCNKCLNVSEFNCIPSVFKITYYIKIQG